MNGVFEVQFVGLIFALFMLLISLFYYAAKWRVKTKPAEGKLKPYMCGEEAKEEASMPHRGFYKTVASGMRFRRLRRLQSGDISDYILALLIGIIVLLFVLVFLW